MGERAQRGNRPKEARCIEERHVSKGYSAIVIGQLGVDGKNSVSRKDFEEELVDFRLGQMAN